MCVWGAWACHRVLVGARKQSTSVDSLFPLVGPGSWTQVIRLDGRAFTHWLTEPSYWPISVFVCFPSFLAYMREEFLG